MAQQEDIGNLTQQQADALKKTVTDLEAQGLSREDAILQGREKLKQEWVFDVAKQKFEAWQNQTQQLSESNVSTEPAPVETPTQPQEPVLPEAPTQTRPETTTPTPISTPVETTRVTTTERPEIKPQTTEPQINNISSFKKAWSTLEGLADLVENRYPWLVAEIRGNEVYGEKDWQPYKWTIDASWNPIATKLDKPVETITKTWEQLNQEFTQMLSGWASNSQLVNFVQKYPEQLESFKSSYFSFTKNKKNTDYVNKYSWYSAEQMYNAVQSWEIVPWTDRWNLLPLETRQSYNAYNKEKTAIDSWTAFKWNDWLLDLSKYVSAYQNLFSSNLREQSEALYNTPEIQAQQWKVKSVQTQINDIDSQIESIDSEFETIYGSKWIASTFATNKQTKAKNELIRQKNSLIAQYNTEAWYLQTLYDNADDNFEILKLEDQSNKQAFEIALSMYQSDRKAMQDREIAEFEAEQARLAEERDFATKTALIEYENQISLWEGEWEDRADWLYFLKKDWSYEKVIEADLNSSFSKEWYNITDYKNDDWTFTSIITDKTTWRREVYTSDITWNLISSNGTVSIWTDFSWLASQYPNEAWASNNNPAWLTYNEVFASRLDEAWIDYIEWGARPEDEWWNYFKFPDIQNWFKAYQLLWNSESYQNLTVQNALNRWGTWSLDLDSSILTKKVSNLTSKEINDVVTAQIQKESPWLYNEMSKRWWITSDWIKIPSVSNSMTEAKRKLSKEEFRQFESIVSKFNSLAPVKLFEEALPNFNNINSAFEQANGTWDMSAIFAFMKSLDPNSVVRESEFEVASKSAWIVEDWAKIFNQIEEWDLLSWKARENFIKVSKLFILNRADLYETKYNDMLKVIRRQWLPEEDLPTNLAEKFRKSLWLWWNTTNLKTYTLSNWKTFNPWETQNTNIDDFFNK